MTRRIGDWMQTATGRAFWPIDPRAEDIDIEDVAHALAHLCRYGGHCLRFYSVAEHSVLLAASVPPEDALWALLHDASEAYIVDVPRPLKPYLSDYQDAERRVMTAVCERFGLPEPWPDTVKEADRAILTDEMQQNMAAPPMPWSTAGTPLGVTLQFWSPPEAKLVFLDVFARLTGRSS